MSVTEVLLFATFVVNLIGLVFQIIRKDRK